MNAKKKNENAEILDRINQFTKDADWSVEEIRNELINEGVNPDVSLKNIRQRIHQLLQKDEEIVENTKEKTNKYKFSLISNNLEVSNQNEQCKISINNAPTLLALICQVTTDTPSYIAQKLGITTSFMKLVNDHCRSIPTPWKWRLINLVCENYPLEEKAVESVIENPQTLQKAALREKEYTTKEISPEEILKISKLNDEAQKYWLKLIQEK